MGNKCTGKDSVEVAKQLDQSVQITKLHKNEPNKQFEKTVLYDLSRLVACHGVQVQRRLMEMKVFVIGLTGLGIQVVKNLILIGPKQVCIYDKNLISISDVGRNFYLNQSQIQKETRVSGSLKKLKQLNPKVRVTESQSDNVQQIIKNFNCVVVLDNYNKQYLIDLNQACRSKNIPYIVGGNLGLYGYVFVDFGQNHKIFDLTGRQPKTFRIKSISNQKKAVVSFHQDGWHGLNNGDIIKIVNVKGMIQLNQKQFIVTIDHNNYNIQLNVDTSEYNAYIDGGQVIQVKKQITLKFRDFKNSLLNPYQNEEDQLICADWSKIENTPQLHLLLNSVYDFYSKKKRIPSLLNTQDWKQFESCAKNSFQLFNQQMKKLNRNTLASLKPQLVEKISNFGQIQISACCSFWGGIITQQIIKSTGKYKPLHQWFHHDFLDIIPKMQRNLNFTNNRYRDYEILFGKQFVQRCHKSNLFIVGAGALGCQYVKMFSLMGLGTKQKGSICVTDDDSIQISNLNRQFLFRESHIGKNKCETACQIGKYINNQSNFISFKLKLTYENQSVFTDSFWDNLDFVVNAVDNVQARNTIDQKCIFYQKPCFQSGTSGTSCSSQIIIPDVTASYSDIGQQKQETIALCTLKSFPYKIQHIIVWAKERFLNIIQTPSQNIINFMQSKEKFLAQVSEKMAQNSLLYQKQLKTLKDFLIISQSNSYEKCIIYFLDWLNKLFVLKIQKLLKQFPEDFVQKQSGKRFWSGKKCPQVLKFDFNDVQQLNFLKGGAHILSDFFGIKQKMTDQQIKQYATSIIQNKQKQQIQEYLKSKQDSTEQLLDYLKNYEPRQKLQLNPIKFDKDGQNNFHLQFLSSITNLRAKNYKIDQIDSLNLKIIAGKIIPAIATTTAMVVGSIGIQIIKFIQNSKKANFMNLSANLSTPDWSFASPLEKLSYQDKEKDQILAAPLKYLPKYFNKWNKIQIKHPKTINQLNQYFQKEFKMDIYLLNSQGITISGQDLKNVFEINLKQLFESKLNKQFDSNKKYLKVTIMSKTNQGVYFSYPTIKYCL